MSAASNRVRVPGTGRGFRCRGPCSPTASLDLAVFRQPGLAANVWQLLGHSRLTARHRLSTGYTAHRLGQDRARPISFRISARLKGMASSSSPPVLAIFFLVALTLNQVTAQVDSFFSKADFERYHGIAKDIFPRGSHISTGE